MINDSDIDVFFSDDFAEDVVWTDVAVLPAISVAHTISAIFDLPSQVQNIGNTGIIIQDITATVKTADVTGISTSDTITVRSVVYKIREILDDGTGITKLILAEAKR